MSDAGVVRLLIFRVGQLLCATEAERVREILPRLGATRIPGAPSVVAGLVNVRGTLVTVVEGWRALRQPEPAAGGVDGTTVLLEVDAGKVLGFTVDEVVDLLAVSGGRWKAGRRCPALIRRWCGPSGAAPGNSSWSSIPTRCSTPFCLPREGV